MNYQNRIIHFYFYMGRNDSFVYNLRSILNHLLFDLKTDLDAGDESALIYLRLLFLCIGQTRDILEGKGERDIAYSMIYVWYLFFPELATFALRCFVLGDCPYGSWKDIRSFCDCVSHLSTDGFDHPLIQSAMDLAHIQLYKDYRFIQKRDRDQKHVIRISNVSKWIPRENHKKRNGLFEKMAEHWFKNYGSIDNIHIHTKQKCIYRKMVSKVSRELDNLPPTMYNSLNKKGKNAKYNLWTREEWGKEWGETEWGETEWGETEWGKEEGSDLRFYKQDLPYETISIGKYIKSMVELIENPYSDQTENVAFLNLKWDSFMRSFDSFENTIPMIDISAGVSTEALYDSIGFACLILSKLRSYKRVMLLSNIPIWINMDADASLDLYSMVSLIWSHCIDRTWCNIHDAISMISSGYENVHSVGFMNFVIFSGAITKSFHSLDLTRCPSFRFVLWNVSNNMNHYEFVDNGYELTRQNMVYLSGSNACLMRIFSDIYGGKWNSWDFTVKILENPRYHLLRNYFDYFCYKLLD